MSSNSILNIKKDGKWVEIPALKGEDGFSPTATVEKVGKVATITITDINGTTTATIADGTGSGGSGEENTIESISVNGTPISIDEHKNVDITVPSIDGLTKDADLATVAKSGSYEDLSNKPTIPDITGLATETYVDNKVADYTKTVDLADVATSGSYNDLADKPTIPSLDGYAKKTDIPTTLPANGGNADTVNDHTVESNVPADAVFTDTTYESVTQTEDGLMSAADKKKLDGVEEGATKTLIDIELSSTSTNPVQNKVVTDALNNKADKSKYSDTTINVGRKAGTTVGDYSTAEGSETIASEYASHAEGKSTIASGYSSHAEGKSTIARGYFSHTEGEYTTAGGYSSHAEGESTTASGYFSHAEGEYTTADNYASHVSGKYNVAMTTGGGSNNTTGTAFVIGNGTSTSALSNAFSVQYSGIVKAKSTITASTTADYAEFFEWLDKNPNEEDRVGYFVTLDGNKIKIATSEDDYILGIVSGEPFVLGNGDCDTWNGMYLHDEFRRTIYEPAPKIIEILDNEGNPTGEYEEVEGEYEGTRPKLNPEYDPTKQYISRFDRTEWSPVGMLGVLAVLHDGTAEVNGYVTVNNEGIATKCTRDTRNSYRVIKKVSDKVVEVIFR